MILYLYAYSNFFMPIIAVFGLLAGSFLNCVIYRLELSQSLESRPRRESHSFLRGRSFCPHCKKTLQWYDLIPVLSFLYLGGRCRYCKRSISWQYPLVELATAILFILIFVFNIQHSLFFILIIPFLIVIFVYDLKHYIIPDKVIYPAIIGVGIWQLAVRFFDLTTNYYLLTTIISAFGAALFFLAIVLITRGKGMGIGDIKLAFLMGLILGWPNILVALSLAFFLGAAAGLILILFKKKTMKSEVPFGPFLIAGLMLALFFGEKMINWYLGFFLLR